MTNHPQAQVFLLSILYLQSKNKREHFYINEIVAAVNKIKKDELHDGKDYQPEETQGILNILVLNGDLEHMKVGNQKLSWAASFNKKEVLEQYEQCIKNVFCPYFKQLYKGELIKKNKI